MDIDKAICAATLWLGGFGAAGLFVRGSHEAVMALTLVAVAPLAWRLAVSAAGSAQPGRVTALDAEALAWTRSASDDRRDPGAGRPTMDAVLAMRQRMYDMAHRTRRAMARTAPSGNR